MNFSGIFLRIVTTGRLKNKRDYWKNKKSQKQRKKKGSILTMKTKRGWDKKEDWD